MSSSPAEGGTAGGFTFACRSRDFARLASSRRDFEELNRGELMSKKCALRIFTWICASESGQEDVTPVCPTHKGSRTHFGRFGTGMIVVCEVGTHLVGLCDLERFEAESEEARGKLISQSEAATA
jgi:hypothetical protein